MTQDGLPPAAPPSGSQELETINQNYECALCLRLLLEPVSVTCGHTFCRSCLEASLEHRTACPLCRQPIVAGRSVNVLIQHMIETSYPRALEARKREQLDEVREDNDISDTAALGGSTTDDGQVALSGGYTLGGGAVGGAVTANAAARQQRRNNVVMFASENLYETDELMFPGAHWMFKATDRVDEYIVDHLLETSREFVVRYKNHGPGDHVGSSASGRASSTSSSSTTSAPPAGSSSASTSQMASYGYLFQIESAEVDREDDTRVVVSKCKQRVEIRGAPRTATRPETGTPMRLCDIGVLQDAVVAAEELVLPSVYHAVRLDAQTGQEIEAFEMNAAAGGGEGAASGRTPDDAKNLAALADECSIYVNFHIEKLGGPARLRYTHHHGPQPMRVARSVMQLKDIELLSWYLCRVLHADTDRKEMWFKTTDLKLRLRDCLQVLRECRQPGACLIMPGSAAWMKLGGQGSSLLLLIIVLVLLYLKGTGQLDQQRFGKGKYVIDFED